MALDIFTTVDREEIKQQAADLVADFDQFYEKKEDYLTADQIVKQFQLEYSESFENLNIKSIDQLYQLEANGVAFDELAATKAGLKRATRRKISELLQRTNTTRDQVVKLLKEAKICHMFAQKMYVTKGSGLAGVDMSIYTQNKNKLLFIRDIFPHYLELETKKNAIIVKNPERPNA